MPEWYYDITGTIPLRSTARGEIGNKKAQESLLRAESSAGSKAENQSSLLEELGEVEVKVEQSTRQQRPTDLASELDMDAQLGFHARSSGTDLRHTKKK